MKRYYGTDREGTEIQVETAYRLGGMNYFSGKEDPRGYYAFARPVERSTEDGMTTISYVLLDGTRVFLLEVNRQSGRAAAEAEGIAEEMAAGLAGRVARDAGIGLTGKYTER